MTQIKEPLYTINFNVSSIFICLVLFLTIGLMIEYQARMSMQEKLHEEIERSRYLLAEETKIYFVSKKEIMPSCLIGQKTH